MNKYTLEKIFNHPTFITHFNRFTFNNINNKNMDSNPLHFDNFLSSNFLKKLSLNYYIIYSDIIEELKGSYSLPELCKLSNTRLTFSKVMFLLFDYRYTDKIYLERDSNLPNCYVIKFKKQIYPTGTLIYVKIDNDLVRVETTDKYLMDNNVEYMHKGKKYTTDTHFIASWVDNILNNNKDAINKK